MNDERCPHDKCRDEMHSRINQRLTKKDLFAVLGIFMAIITVFVTLLVNNYNSAMEKREQAIEANSKWNRSQEERLQGCERGGAVLNVELNHIKERLSNIEAVNMTILKEVKKLGNGGS